MFTNPTSQGFDEYADPLASFGTHDGARGSGLTITDVPTTVPEPGTVALLGPGVAMFALHRRTRTQ
jgi:hypothetical protein